MKSTAKKNKAQLKSHLSSEEIAAMSKKAFEEATAITWRQAEVRRCLTQNDKISLVDDKTLVIGADIGSEKHDIRDFDNRGREFSRKAFEFINDEAGFVLAKEWMVKSGRHTTCRRLWLVWNLPGTTGSILQRG